MRDIPTVGDYSVAVYYYYYYYYSCGGLEFDASSIWVLVSAASLSSLFGLPSLNSFPSISRESWASFTPWPERGELPMRLVGSGDAKVYKDPVIQ